MAAPPQGTGISKHQLEDAFRDEQNRTRIDSLRLAVSLLLIGFLLGVSGNIISGLLLLLLQGDSVFYSGLFAVVFIVVAFILIYLTVKKYLKS